jgi:hypothetical protein
LRAESKSKKVLEKECYHMVQQNAGFACFESSKVLT